MGKALLGNGRYSISGDQPPLTSCFLGIVGFSEFREAEPGDTLLLTNRNEIPLVTDGRKPQSSAVDYFVFKASKG
jgi:hypothetical protein